MFHIVINTSTYNIHNASCWRLKLILDLYNDEFRAGCGEANDLVFTLNEVSESSLKIICKVHFVIIRENCDLTSPVYIKDLSRNGTFVNDEKIGKNYMRMLKNDDVISICQCTPISFVFQDCISMNLLEEITSTYHVKRLLGVGGFGKVFLVYHTCTCQQFALKFVKKKSVSKIDSEKALIETKIMKDLSHPCVVRMLDIIDKPDAFYMLLDYIPGGDLLARVQKKKFLKEQTSKLYFYQMCQAVKYLHDRCIVHCDLKLANFLLATKDEETLLKVCDFGLSTFVPKCPDAWNRGYTRKVDIWSLGVSLFCCLSGTFPFNDDKERIRKGEFYYQAEVWKSVSLDAKLMINKIFNVDRKRRPSINGVLRSSWLLDPQMIQKAEKLMKLESLESEKENYLPEPSSEQLLD